jgi:hypothetical protein
MKLPRSRNSRNLRSSLKPQAAARSDRNPSGSLFSQTANLLRSGIDIGRSTRSKQSPAASRDHIFQCIFQICCYIERAMKGHLERRRLLDQPAHAIAVYASIEPKNSRNKSAHTKRSGIFEIFLHERKLGIGVDEISSARTQNCVYGQAALAGRSAGERMARRKTAFTQGAAQLNAIRPSLAGGRACLQALRTYLKHNPATQNSTSNDSGP